MSTLNRWTVAEAILDAVRSSPMIGVGVSVTATWPGDEIADEAVWLDSLEGELSNPVLNAGRRYRDDLFEVPLNVRIAGKPTDSQTMLRLAEICGAIESVMAEPTTVLEVEGVISVDAPEVSMFGAEMRDGFIGRGEVRIPVHSRLT